MKGRKKTKRWFLEKEIKEEVKEKFRLSYYCPACGKKHFPVIKGDNILPKDVGRWIKEVFVCSCGFTNRKDIERTKYFRKK
jgi:C4-type Zn-finger protein